MRFSRWIGDWNGRRTALGLGLLAVSAAFAGCSAKSAEERLVGKWKGKVEINEQAVADELAKTGDADSAKQVFEALQTMQVDIEFQAGGKLNMSAAAQTPAGADTQSITGTWNVIAHDGDQITIESHYEGDDVAEEIEIKLEGDDAFSTRPPGPNHEIGVLRMKRMR
jgi:hypothetical protein